MVKAPLDLAIIGAGPAALTAALYASRAGLKVEVFERKNLGGTLAEIDHISNYPGFVGTGNELGQIFRQQAEQFGAVLTYGECEEIGASEQGFNLAIDDTNRSARAVLVATGSQPRELDFELNKPVSYCAICDGDLVKDQDIAVVGGANSALQEALYLSEIASKVTIITHSKLKADQKLQATIASHKNIVIRENTEATPDLLNSFDHIFVYIGRRPASDCVKDLGILNYEDYIITGHNKGLPHMTPVAGLFAAGDVRENAIKQVVTAAADGAAAALEIFNYLNK